MALGVPHCLFSSSVTAHLSLPATSLDTLTPSLVYIACFPAHKNHTLPEQLFFEGSWSSLIFRLSFSQPLTPSFAVGLPCSCPRLPTWFQHHILPALDSLVIIAPFPSHNNGAGPANIVMPASLQVQHIARSGYRLPPSYRKLVRKLQQGEIT
jgi:hypothetical protein